MQYCWESRGVKIVDRSLDTLSIQRHITADAMIYALLRVNGKGMSYALPSNVFIKHRSEYKV